MAQVGASTVGAAETAPEAGSDDQAFGSIEEALDAFGGDDEDREEQTEGDETLTDDDEADDMTDEADDEADEDEGDDVDEDGEEGDDEASEDGEERVFTFPDGSTKTEQEIVESFWREKDYTQKTQALAADKNRVMEIESRYRSGAQDVIGIYERAIAKLSELIPPEPSLELARQDPGAYQYERALREASQKELQEWMADREELLGGLGRMSQQDTDEAMRQSGLKLLEARPELSDPAQWKTYHETNYNTALELGFSDDEIAKVYDWRISEMLYYTNIGKRAVHNRKATKRRLSEAPRKGQKALTAKTGPPSKRARNRFAQTGSLEDAMKLDF